MPERGTVPAEAIGGWLSPTGDYWPCADWQHTRVAERIIAELMIPRGRYGTALENHGWVHIDDNGTVLDDDHDIYTQAQLDYMFDLARVHPSMRDNLMAALKRQTAAVGDEGMTNYKRLSVQELQR